MTEGPTPDRLERTYVTLWSQEMYVRSQRAAAATATVKNVRDVLERRAREGMAHLTALVSALSEDELAGYREYRAAKLDEIRDMPTD